MVAGLIQGAGIALVVAHLTGCVVVVHMDVDAAHTARRPDKLEAVTVQRLAGSTILDAFSKD